MIDVPSLICVVLISILSVTTSRIDVLGLICVVLISILGVITSRIDVPGLICVVLISILGVITSRIDVTRPYLRRPHLYIGRHHLKDRCPPPYLRRPHLYIGRHHLKDRRHPPYLRRPHLYIGRYHLKDRRPRFIPPTCPCPTLCVGGPLGASFILAFDPTSPTPISSSDCAASPYAFISFSIPPKDGDFVNTRNVSPPQGKSDPYTSCGSSTRGAQFIPTQPVQPRI